MITCPKCVGMGIQGGKVVYDGINFYIDPDVDFEDCDCCHGTGRVTLWRWLIEKWRGRK